MGLDASIMRLVQKFQDENAKTKLETGACLIYVSDESKQYCVYLTEEQCMDVGGVFVDGPCPTGTVIP